MAQLCVNLNLFKCAVQKGPSCWVLACFVWIAFSAVFTGQVVFWSCVQRAGSFFERINANQQELAASLTRALPTSYLHHMQQCTAVHVYCVYLFFWTKYVIVRRISSKNIFTIFIIKIHFFGVQDLWTKHHLMKENLSAKYLVPTLFAMTILMVPKPVNFCQLCNLVLGLELMFEEKNLASDTLNYIMCPRNRIS